MCVDGIGVCPCDPLLCVCVCVSCYPSGGGEVLEKTADLILCMYMYVVGYHLTRLEGKVGSPERPLSDLGLLTYRSYWMSIVVGYIAQLDTAKDTISIKGLSF